MMTKSDQYEKYINNLINQFALAKGISNVDINSEEFINEFNEWLIEQKNIGKEYLSILDEIGFNIDDSNCIEVGKGKYDSIVKDLSTTIITPDYTLLYRGLRNRVINGDINVLNGYPMLINYTSMGNIMSKYFINSNIYMTQNPFNSSNILNWDKIYNSGNNIIIGSYGKTQDKDKNKKIDELIEFKNKLQDDFICENIISGDTYINILGSNPKVKKLVKSI